MGRPSATALGVARLLEQEAESGVRFVDMRIALLIGGEPLLTVGGRWDRRIKQYIPGARDARVLRVHAGQEAAARWLADWTTRRRSGDWTGFQRVWSALFVGGRRGGKTHLGCSALAVFAVMLPGTLVWAVSPTQEETDELDRELRAVLPRAWYRHRAAPKHEFKLANGSTIRLLSGFKPHTLKRGRVDFVLYNEGQRMSHEGYIQLRGAVADSGGLVVVAANPPDDPIGAWVEELWEKARAGTVKSIAFSFDPAKNPFIEHQALADMASEVDEKTFRREVLGEFVPVGDRVFYAWSDSQSVRAVPPGFVDITREFTSQHFGRAFDAAIGADFQLWPMVAVVLRMYRDPADATSTPLLWIVEEFVLEDADEFQLVDALEAAGYTGASTVVVCDASGDWQFSERERTKVGELRRRVKGRGSHDVFRARGWPAVYPPDSQMDRNPEVSERVKVGNALLRSAEGKRRLFSLPSNEQVNRGMKRWEMRDGAPNRRSEFAHVCDAVTYPCWRFFPRRRPKSGAVEIKVLKRFDGKRRTAGW